MKKIPSLLLSAFFLAVGASARADTLELKNGTVLQGKYLGGTAETVRFETSDGMQILEFSQVRNMTVSAAAPAPAARPTPAPLPSTVTLPGGTQILVRMMDSVSSKSAQGATFTTKLEYDLVASGVVVARAGTVIYGKVQSATQARRAAGRSTLDIRLTQMVPGGGTPIPIMTSSYAQAGESSGGKVARAAAAGAIIGNNTGNGSGSDGAAIGAGVAMLKPGQTLTIPPGTVLEFTLEQPVVVAVKH